jgi:hypothetical protein
MSAFPTPDRTVTRNGCVHRSGRRVLGSPARASNTLAQVRALLGDIEPTEQTFASLDRDDIPHLETLLGDPEEWLASRAVHALSRLDDAGAHDLIKRAAVDPRGAVRVAVASAVPRLPEPLAERLLSDFLDDADVGSASSRCARSRWRSRLPSVPRSRGWPMPTSASRSARWLRPFAPACADGRPGW